MHISKEKKNVFKGGRGGNVSVTCGTPADSTTTELVFTVTTSSTLGSKFPMQSNMGKFLLPPILGFVLVFIFNKSVLLLVMIEFRTTCIIIM